MQTTRFALMVLMLAHGLLAADAPDWYEPMKKLNEEFKGNPGYVAQFGDSITYSMAFWSVCDWMDPGPWVPADEWPKAPEGKRWRDVIKGARAKGPEQGNYSGWTIGQVLAVADSVLQRENPEAAIIMIGTNDISGGGVPPGYREGVAKLIEKCLAAKCIPVLNTIPYRRGRVPAVEAANVILRELAKQYRIPLVDYAAEMLKRRPGDTWDGTLMGEDGIHPSAGNTADYSPDNLKVSGYALRNYLNFIMFRELYFRILTAPKAFVEAVGTVETVRPGLRCPVTADTEVSTYQDAKDNERIWNWGKASRLKCKGFEEYILMKFDVSQARGWTLKRATLYLSRTEQCVLNVMSPSTVSTDWAEGTGTGEPANKQDQGAASRGGATYTHAVYPDRPWAGPGSNVKFVVFGHGGSRYGVRSTGWAKDDQADYYSVEVPLEVAQGLLVPGDTFGLAFNEEKGQRAFQKTYRRVPNPNHFVNSRESAKPCFLVLEGEAVDQTPPAPVTAISAEPGAEAGDVVLHWTGTADDGAAGGPALGYRVYLAPGKLGPAVVAEANLLSRYRTWRPVAPGARQDFAIGGLQPGQEHTFAIVAYDEVGNLSTPAVVTGTPRAARQFTLQRFEFRPGIGAPLANERLRAWAAPSNAKLSPLTGNCLEEGTYAQPAGAGTSRNGNSVWDGKAGTVVLFAGRNDFAGFQLAVENRGRDPLVGLAVTASDLTLETAFTPVNRYVLLAGRAPAEFQAAMRDVLAKDRDLGNRVFAALKRLSELKKQQADDPAAFFADMEKLRAGNPAEYDNWMYLLGGGKAAGAAIPAKNLGLFWEWAAKDAGGAWYPDALVPLAGKVSIPNVDNQIPGQTVQTFYVDVFVPHQTPPGNYVGELTLTAAAGEPLSVPLRLTVWNYRLPDELTFFSEMNGYGYPTFDPKNHWEGVLNLHRLAHANRLNVNMVPVSHSGNFTVGEAALEVTGRGKERRVTSFATFEQCFGPLFSGKAFLDQPRAGVPITACYVQFYENWPSTTKEGFVFDQTARHLDVTQDFTPEYKDAYVAVARQTAAWLKEKGYTRTQFQAFLNSKYQYADDVTFWLLDEPMFRDDYLVIQMFAQLTREGFRDAAPVKVDFRIDVSRIQEARGLMDQVDLIVGSLGNLSEFGSLLEEMKTTYQRQPGGAPRQVWVYSGTVPATASTAGNRAYTLEAWLFGCDGQLPWLAYGTDASWDNVAAANEAVFYPATAKWGYNGAYGSLRMKAYRDGQQDAEYLNLLTRQLGATRREMRNLLAGIVTLKGQVQRRGPEDAGVVTYRGLTPDDLEGLRRTLGYNLHQGAK